MAMNYNRYAQELYELLRSDASISDLEKWIEAGEDAKVADRPPMEPKKVVASTRN